MIYVYQCPTCKALKERVRKVEQRNNLVNCPICNIQMERIPSFHGGLKTEHPVWLDQHARDVLQVENEAPVTTRKEHDAYCAERGIVHD